MKKKILLALIAIILTTPAWAKVKEQNLEEVVLDVPQEEMNVEEVPQAISVTEEKDKFYTSQSGNTKIIEMPASYKKDELYRILC